MLFIINLHEDIVDNFLSVWIYFFQLLKNSFVTRP